MAAILFRRQDCATCAAILTSCILVTITTTTAVAQMPLWIFCASSGPSGRYGHAMVYDVARARVVLFSGDAGAPNGETWEWDSSGWTQRQSNGPSPRVGHGMAYDAARGRVVLFGGGNVPGPLGDTWLWDGVTWTELSGAGPPARFDHAMAYDEARGEVVLFGGGDGSGERLNDTWVWDGSAWTLRATTGPSPRRQHAMAYDSARQRVVLFGGWDGPSYGDTWLWDGASWTQAAVGGPAPSPRFSHAMSFSEGNGEAVILLFGGVESNPNSYYGDTWAWDGSAWAMRDPGGPSPRFEHAMTYDSVHARVVLFGGRSDAQQFDGETWQYRLGADCNTNGTADDCEPGGTSQDCDTNGRPDECDSDTDSDGYIDGCDNCPLIPNPSQSDCDSDGTGDACEVQGVPITVSFSEGTGGYFGCVDTSLQSDFSDMSFCVAQNVAVDWMEENHGLIRFENVIGVGPNQVPPGAVIVSATLTLDLSNLGGISTAFHRMLSPWECDDTWDDWGNGVQADGTEALSPADAIVSSTFITPLVVDVTTSFQAWALGSENNGWVLLPGMESADGWEFSSAEHSQLNLRPLLQVTFGLPLADCDSNGTPDDCDPDDDQDGLINGCDNCPDVPNADQADCDGNSTGDACENFGPPVTVVYVQGSGLYGGCVDTTLRSEDPTSSFGDDVVVIIDKTPTRQGLLRFEQIIGYAPGQIPPGSAIASATLSLDLTNPGDISTSLHRMLQPWMGADTWQEWGGGIQPDGVVAEEQADAVIPVNDVCCFDSAPVVDVTNSLQAWSSGVPNYGWALLPGDEHDNGWIFASSDNSDPNVVRPRLEVTFRPLLHDCNSNGVPDECEADTDSDGIIDDCDGCPNDPYKIEPGICGCGIADMPDTDGDGVPDGCDNCPAIPNSDQADLDDDGIGDACDADRDGDGVPNDEDACPDNRPGLPVDCNGQPLRDCNGDCLVDGEDIQCIVAELLGQ